MSFTRPVWFLLTILLMICLLKKSSTAPADDDVTRAYILETILPDHPFLAAKLLSLLATYRPDLTSSLLQVRHEEEEARQIDLSDVIEAIRPSQKRGLGQCIHNCINGRGNMNFIQCKSMCH